VAAEWSLAVLLLIWPGSWFVRFAVFVLFIGFAGLGLFALVSGRQVECGCFGAVKNSRLGWQQIVQLPFVGAALLLTPTHAGWSSFGDSMIALVFVHATVAAVFLVMAARPWRMVRGQRISMAGVTGPTPPASSIAVNTQ
jgi:hypothetical protein